MPDKDGNLTRAEQEQLARNIELMKSGDIPIPGSNVIPFHGRNGDTPEGTQLPRKLPVSRPVTAEPRNAPELPFYESITRVQSEELGIQVRVWRSVPEIPTGPDAEVLKAFRSIVTTDTMVTMAYKFAGIPDVAAFEITDKNGLGVVVYTDW